MLSPLSKRGNLRRLNAKFNYGIRVLTVFCLAQGLKCLYNQNWGHKANMRLREDTDAVSIGIICDAHPSNVMFSISQCNTIVHK